MFPGPEGPPDPLDLVEAGEARAGRELQEDARHWVAVYTHLLDFSVRLGTLEGSDRKQRELERRLRARLRFWRERRRKLSGAG